MEHLFSRRDDADVLVIGGGLAGMYAAIEASRRGCRVRLLSKGRTGSSGASLVSMSVHRYAPDQSDARADYRRRFLASGGGLCDPALAAVLIDRGAEAVEGLTAFGLPLEYRFLDTSAGPVSYLACCAPKTGRNLTVPLRDYLERHTAVLLEDGVMAAELVTAGGRVTGVLAERDNALAYYAAQAVVLATGGCGNIYRFTSDTSDLTGDGYAMAERRGLPLRDMEFIQFYPYRIHAPRRADIFPDIFDHGALFRNERGERFMDAFPKKELENRDVLAREIYRQKEVRLDLAQCDWEYLSRECPPIARMARDFPDAPLLVRPVAHFCMGGVAIGPDCTTGLGGLFACGEVTGGLHGANRLSGSALTEAAVFGKIAGEQAAACVLPRPGEAAELAAAGDLAAQLLAPDPGLPLADRMLLRERMWQDASVERTQGGLRSVSAYLAELEGRLAAARGQDLRKWLELRNMAAVSRQVVSGALARPESLGAHCIRP